jgi:hypothetical protein
METDDYDNIDDISVTKYNTYADFLDKFITHEDRIYLEDEDLARDVKELYAVNKGDIKCKKDFDDKKREIEMRDKQDETKEKPLYSEGKNFEKDTFLWHLADREYDVRNGRKSTIIFIRYREQNGKEVSAYIDYRERLKNENFELIFDGEKDLIPKPTDLSYYNWTIQKVYSNDSTFFRVDAGPKERLSFRNNTDRKIINVDLEFLSKHQNLDVKRLPIEIVKTEIKKIEESNGVSKKDKKKEKDEDPEKLDKMQFGYKQIVIFDYETRSK